MVKSGAASMAALFAGVSVSATLVIARRVSQRGLLEARRGVRTMVPIPAHLARRAETQAAASVRQWAVQQQQRYTRDAAAKAASSSDSNGEQTAASSSASSSASADTPSSSSSSSSTIPSGAQVVGARLPVPAAPGTGTKIRVGQYNILAGKLGLSKYFPYCKEEHLAWPHRKWTLLRNMRDLNADILCTQELDNYWSFFKVQLEALGYGSAYAKRPSLHTSSRSGVFKADGCGLFFRKTTFAVEQVQTINYDDPHDRVALVALLRHRGTGTYVIAATTHLYWNPTKVSTQLAELQQLDKAVRHMLRCAAAQGADPGRIPVIVTGDFNNYPTSAVYAYALNHLLQGPEPQLPLFDSTPDYKAVEHISVPPVAMRSAYAQYGDVSGQLAGRHRTVREGATHLDHQARPSEPTHTTVTHRRCATIDYVWYSPLTLRVTGLLSIPSERELRLGAEAASEAPVDEPLPALSGIPNKEVGSDHVALLAELELLQLP